MGLVQAVKRTLLLRRCVLAAAALSLTCMLGSCSDLTFRPRYPRQTRSDLLTFELESVLVAGPPRGQAGSKVQVHLRVLSATAPLLPREAGVADARLAVCEGAALADAMRISGEPCGSPLRALRSNDRLVVTLDGSDWRDALAAPSRLDVLMEGERGTVYCATLPLIDANPQIALVSETDWAVGGGVAGEGFIGELGDINGVVEFPMSLSLWTGPARLTTTFSPGVAQCPERVCEPDDDDKVANAPYLPLKLAADVGHSFGLFRVALGAGYRVAAARVDARTGRYWMLLHGPTLTPRLGISLPEPLAPGVPGGERVGGFIGLEVPVSYVWSSRDERALAIGGALMWTVALH